MHVPRRWYHSQVRTYSVAPSPSKTSECGLVSASRVCRRCNLHTGAAFDCHSTNAQKEKDHTDEPVWTFTLRTRDYIGLTHAPHCELACPKPKLKGCIKDASAEIQVAALFCILEAGVLLLNCHMQETLRRQTCIALYYCTQCWCHKPSFSSCFARLCIFCCTFVKPHISDSHIWTSDVQLWQRVE